MQVIILLCLLVAIAAVVNIYFKNLRQWNDGYCAETGQPWEVVEMANGDLYLFSGMVARKLNGILVPGVIARQANKI